MAFNSTTDRYQYIYGNVAQKLEKTEQRSRFDSYAPALDNPPNRAAKQKKTAKKRIAAKTGLAYDWKYTVMIAMAVLVISACSIFYVSKTVEIRSLSADIQTMKTTKAELEGKQTAIQAEIDKNINLDKIRTYAEKKLNMVDPDNNNVIHYVQDSSDYFRQYESVSK